MGTNVGHPAGASQPPQPPQPPREAVREQVRRTIEEVNAAVEDVDRSQAREPAGEPARAQTAPPSGRGDDAASRMRDELEGARDAVAAQAGAAGVAGAAGAAQGNVSVLKDPQGRVVITGRDGRTVTIDPSVGMDEDAVEDAVQTALAPQLPELPRNLPSDGAIIVGTVFSFLFLITLVIAAASVLKRRAAAAAAGGAVLPDLGVRLARIEQAVESVAIEVERISEAQRFSARLLAERLPEGVMPNAMPHAQAALPGLPPSPPTTDIVR